MADMSSAGEPLLLAWDESPASVAAARIVRALAMRTEADACVVHALNMRAAPILPPLDAAVGLRDPIDGPGLHEQMAGDVRAAIAGVLGTPVAWPVRIALGTPAESITHEAGRIGAALTVLGLRPHSALARALRNETVVTVMRSIGRPVLAVPEGLTGLPRRAVIGVDFSRVSLRAAQAALGVLDAGASIRLVYVTGSQNYGPEDHVPLNEPDEGRRTIYQLGVEAAFDWFIGSIGAPEGVSIDRTIVSDMPATSASAALLSQAADDGAELIVLANRRHRSLDRWVVGSVTADIVRDGRIAVLAVPPLEDTPPSTDTR